MHPPEAAARIEIPALIAGWLGAGVRAVSGAEAPGVDLVVEAGGQRLAFEVKTRDDIPTLERAVAALHRASLPPGTLRIVALPYAGPGARRPRRVLASSRGPSAMTTSSPT